MDENYNLLGFVHLIDLLKAIRPLCDKPDEPCELPEATTKLKELVVPFAGAVHPDDSILKALDIMMDHNVSQAPVMETAKSKEWSSYPTYLTRWRLYCSTNKIRRNARTCLGTTTSNELERGLTLRRRGDLRIVSIHFREV